MPMSFNIFVNFVKANSTLSWPLSQCFSTHRAASFMFFSLFKCVSVMLKATQRPSVASLRRSEELVICRDRFNSFNRFNRV